MAEGYGQYCPLALAAELLSRRWMILVVSRLIDGCATFGEIQRGLPQISPSILAKRLGELVDAGIAVHVAPDGERSGRYRLTDAGRDFQPVVDAMAVWGQHWARDMKFEDLDPAFLVWSMHLRADPAQLPGARLVIEFEFSDSPTNCRRFWLVCNGDDVEMCLKDPGLEPDVAVRSDLRVFVEAWRGFRDFRQEIARKTIRLYGPSEVTRRIPDFLLGSALAPHGRKRDGRERSLALRTARIARPTNRAS